MEYFQQALRPHLKMWDEATLFAAVWFIRYELGIKKIFYHTYEGGNLLKGLEGWPPPRSLYTKLPRKFCFQETSETPEFVEKRLPRKMRKQMREGKIRFYLMEL